VINPFMFILGKAKSGGSGVKIPCELTPIFQVRC
jgi:hypothetical protein